MKLFLYSRASRTQPPDHPERRNSRRSTKRDCLGVLKTLGSTGRRLADLDQRITVTAHWDETNAQRDGTIRRRTCFPAAPDDLVVSGPLFFVGVPLNKTPRTVCTLSSHYDVLDLTALPTDYLPRTNYVAPVVASSTPNGHPKCRGRTGNLTGANGAESPTTTEWSTGRWSAQQ